jgi:predicted AlkP superfamily pyrophosphatase or phosphodiesterase
VDAHLAQRPSMGGLIAPRRRSLVSSRTLAKVLALFLAALVPSAGMAGEDDDPAVSLVVLVVVDQLAGGVLEKNRDRFVDGGFRRLMDHGVSYTRAFHRFSPTATGPAHATLSTGALPPVHGIAANEWRDPIDGRTVYGVFDPDHQILGHPTRDRDGTSPANLEAETLADLLAEATSGRGRAFALSMKDRAAILLAGRRGKALWYSKATVSFVSSDFYFEALPGWVARFNTAYLGALDGARWELSRPAGEYAFAERDDQPWERDYAGLGTTFPHDLAETSDLGSALRFTPMADELLLGLAGEILRNERLGRSGSIDMLAISLSATDYVGHAFGPDSLEAEDNLLRLDASLEAFLDRIDRSVGLDRTLVALSSDHGIPSAPEWTRLHGGGAVGRVDTPAMIAGLRERLRERFDLAGDPLFGFSHPAVFLDDRLLSAGGVDIVEAERAAAEYLAGFEGIRAAYTRTDILAGEVGGTRETDRVAAGFHPSRSGHVVVVQHPGWHLDKWPGFFATTHGSPYDYDAHVPMIFRGPGLRSASLDREVGSESFAPSVARYLGLRPPADATGRPLAEIARPGRSYNPAH